MEIGPSPLWLKERLTAGRRPINSVVDITSYVMLLTARPRMFDLDKVPDGALIIRTADEGER